MATPPRPDNTTRKPTETTRETPQKAGRSSSWLIYGLAATIVIVVILFLLGTFGGSEEEIATEPTMEKAPTANETTDVPAVVVAPESDTATEITPAKPDGNIEKTDDPASDSASDSETMIEVEGDAEVEILDESTN